MKHLRWLTAAALAVAVLILAGRGPRAAADDKEKEDVSPLVGKPAPNFKGDFAINGEPVSLSDLRGKVVVLDFWAVWCGPCIESFPHLTELHKDFKDKGVVVLGITSYYKQFGFDKEAGKLKKVGKVEEDKDTGKEKVVGGLSPREERLMLKDFAAHHKLAYHLMALNKHEWNRVTPAYEFEGYPTMVVIDRKGIVRLVKVGFNEDNARAVRAEVEKLVKTK
jgi:thiol-disulfide isomerase/thioredoxin